jgi:hypothetical protein
MDDTGEVCTKRSLNRQADAKAGTDQAFDAFAAYIMSHHFWPVCWRGRSGDNHVMNLMSGITSAQQKRFALEVGPMNNLIGGQAMARRLTPIRWWSVGSWLAYETKGMSGQKRGMAAGGRWPATYRR